VAHLNTTLRGLSLGGRFLSCDCRLRWVAEWIARGDLQVTSRERNPQFCGSPAHLKDRSFYAIQPAGKASPHYYYGLFTLTASQETDPLQ
jgi:hypothetical protein